MKHSLQILFMTLLISAYAFLASCSSPPPHAEMKAAIPDISIASVKNGVYEGKHFLFPVKVRVKVSVSGGRITQILSLEHFNGKGKPAEAIIGSVTEKQSLKVDAISGATHSSLTILKAIEAALLQGK